MRICTLVLLLLVGMASALCQDRIALAPEGSHPGFSADSHVTMSFQYPSYSYKGATQQVTATITVSETHGLSGGVTVSGAGTVTPSSFTLPYNSQYSRSVTVTLPAAPGAYNYTAKIFR